MPIKGISDAVRTPVELKVYLGVRKGPKTYPKDVDYFAIKDSGGEVIAKVKAAYPTALISDAWTEDGSKVLSLGKSLRLMLPWEFDATNPQNGQEIALGIYNLAYEASGLRCKGDGGNAENPGTAVLSKKEWLPEIEKATGAKATILPRERFEVVCLGMDCPLQKGDEPRCKATLRLQAQLLHPTTDPEHKDYGRVLAWVQLVSGSYNAMVDIGSGFKALRATVGRTELLPFTLRRVMTPVQTGEKRVNHALLKLSYDLDEVAMWAAAPRARAILRPAVRERLAQVAAAEMGYGDVRDIHEPRRALPPAVDIPSESDGLSETLDPSGDRDEAIAQAQEEAQVDEAELDRRLGQGERDELKVLCGGTPGQPASLEHFRALVAEAFEAMPPPLGVQVALDLLTVRHALWIKDRVRAEQADPDDQQGAA